MRILHVVTLVSPRGEFGGPVRVAVEQLTELNRRGHETVLLGAARGWDSTPSDVEGVRASLHRAIQVLPGLGFSGMVAPGELRAARRLLGTADVVHVHLARDLVTLPVARWALARGLPLVVQGHGMIDPSGSPLARPLDALATRPVLRWADAVLALTSTEEQHVEAVAGRPLTNVKRLVNGLKPMPAPEADHPDGPVLFLARLQERKRPEVFVEAAAQIIAARPSTRFEIVGPDEGMRDVVDARIAQLGITANVSVRDAVSSEEAQTIMRRASVYVLPSVNEPFPVSVLEAMRAALPVVLTETCGLSPHVQRAGAGVVTDGSADAIAHAVLGYLDDHSARRDAGRAGRTLVETEFSIAAVVDELESIYSEAVSSRSRKSS